MVLARTLVRIMSEDRKKLELGLCILKEVKYTANLSEELGEIVITLLMKPNEVKEAVNMAVNEVFGEDFKAVNVSVSGGGLKVHYKIKKQ